MIRLIELIFLVVYLVDGMALALLLVAVDVREGRRPSFLDVLACILAWPSVLWDAATGGS